MKKCSKCKEYKEKTEFYSNKSRHDGLQHLCKVCKKEVKAASYLKCKEHEKERNKRYYRNNKSMYVNALAKRRAKKLQATPAWANTLKIKAYYDICSFFNEVNGYTKYHVDHIIPLQGKSVSGLHVENNLQVILAEENHKKSNSFDAVSGY